jgi:hypothetical protein
VDGCVLLVDECVNNCSVFSLEKDCVENHCKWEIDECKPNCYNKTDEAQCELDDLCFWLERKIGTTVGIQCVDKVLSLFI